MSVKAVSWAFGFNLDTATKFTLVALAEHHNGKTGQCNPSQESIAAKTGQSETTIKRQIKFLVAKNLIKIERRYNDKGHRAANGYVLEMDTKPDDCGLGYEDPKSLRWDFGDEDPKDHKRDLGDDETRSNDQTGFEADPEPDENPKCLLDGPKCHSWSPINLLNQNNEPDVADKDSFSIEDQESLSRDDINDPELRHTQACPFCYLSITSNH